MFHHSKSGKISYGIVGVGRFGSALACELAAAGADIVVIDSDEDKVREMRELTDNAYIVANLEKKTLTETGIQNCDVAVVCIGEKMDISILTTLNLVSLGIPKVISKASSAEHGLILEKLGAEVVYPERDMAIRLANRLENAKALDYVQLSEKINVSKILVPDKAGGRTVVDINLRSRFGLNIIAVENGGKVTEIVSPDYVFEKGDLLYVSGGKEDIKKLNDWLDE